MINYCIFKPTINSQKLIMMTTITWQACKNSFPNQIPDLFHGFWGDHKPLLGLATRKIKISPNKYS